MFNSVYESYAEVLSYCQSHKDDLETLLDPENGFAPRLRQICRDRVTEIKELGAGGMNLEDVELLNLEQNTWGLLQAVMPARKTELPPPPSARSILKENPYTPTSTLAQAVLDSSPLLTELVVVREWLQDTAPLPVHPEVPNGYWRFTHHGVMQARRTGGSLRDGLVSELDPDAVNRGDGRALAADDVGYEKGLAQALYAYIRAGRLDDAAELCRKAHQPWRAASIRGSILFQWKAISNEPHDEEMADEDGDIWLGNKNRRLWKTTCVCAALNPNLNEPERVLYAALAPSPQTFSILKSACRTWEDHLWAQVSIMCEEKESAEMHRLGGGGFWEGGVAAVEKGTGPAPTREEEDAEEQEWEKEAVNALERLKDVGVKDGPPADHPFHFSQLHIILDRTDSLLEAFAEGLRDSSFNQDSSEYSIMARFFAHLCLFLQIIDVTVPPLATQVILEAYLQVLEAAGQRDLIALYAGALGDNAVERYAMFLTSLELSADVSERHLALTRARDHGLDMNRVALATAERTIEKAFEVLPSLNGPLPSIIAFQSPPTEAEQLLLRSIEWTIFSPETFDTALEQANVVLRYFLGSGRILIAKALLEMLPPDLASIRDSEQRATEYLQYRQFFTIWTTLERVVECQALDVMHMNRDTRVAWLADYKGLVEQAQEQIIKLLTSEWLLSDEEVDDRRSRELVRIRQIYIPELIIRLHSALYASRHKIPQNLKNALQLANIVADSRYRLYDAFSNSDGRRLADYLGAVRRAVLGGLDGGGSDPFRVISQMQAQ